MGIPTFCSFVGWGRPSVSTKNHLPYFEEEEPWVNSFIEWEKKQKLLNTYIGIEGHMEEKIKRDGDVVEQWVEPTGIWQYIAEDGCIRPSYWLHRVVTGRTSSSEPNGQNFPKHGELAEEYRKIFIPHDGYSILAVDLSQAELRIAAWMANEKKMLKIYREGGDIHAYTAAAILGKTAEVFKAALKDKTALIDVANNWKGAGNFLQKLSPGRRKAFTVAEFCKEMRQRAKAVLCFCLARASQSRV